MILIHIVNDSHIDAQGQVIHTHPHLISEKSIGGPHKHPFERSNA